MKSLELKVPPLLILFVFMAMAWGLAKTGYGRINLGSPPVLSLACMSLGAAIVLAAALQFRLRKTTVDPREPFRTTSLVTGGMSRISRNPMYLGFTLILLGFVLRLGSLPALATLPLFMAYLQKFQILPEERALEAKFGAAYLEYRRRTRRWI